MCSLRRKRFQSNYCAKVGAGAKKRCNRPNFLDELALKRLLRRLTEVLRGNFPCQPVQRTFYIGGRKEIREKSPQKKAGDVICFGLAQRIGNRE